MALKNATICVAVALGTALVIDFTQWLALSFDILPYRENLWLFKGVTLVSMLLKSIPMIFFFLVLNSQQREG